MTMPCVIIKLIDNGVATFQNYHRTSIFKTLESLGVGLGGRRGGSSEVLKTPST